METRVQEVLKEIKVPTNWDYAWIHMAGGASPYVAIELFRGEPSRERTFIKGNHIASVTFPYPAYTELGFEDDFPSVTGIPVKRSGNPDWMKAVYDRHGKLVEVE